MTDTHTTNANDTQKPIQFFHILNYKKMLQSIKSFQNADFVATVAVFIVKKNENFRKRYINDTHGLSVISHSPFQSNRIYIMFKMGDLSSSEQMFAIDSSIAAQQHYLSTIDKCKAYVKESADTLAGFMEKLDNLNIIQE